jgi:hypothetical protein
MAHSVRSPAKPAAPRLRATTPTPWPLRWYAQDHRGENDGRRPGMRFVTSWQGTPSDDWLFHFDFSSLVDFCVWVLEWDGLHVPPFDHHAGGTGDLRAAGLTAAGWWKWFTSNVEGTDFQPEFSSRINVPMIADWVEVLWPYYQHALSDQRRDLMRPFVMAAPFDGLWGRLQPYHARLDCLRIHIVAYGQHAECALPPHHVVLGVPTTGIDQPLFHAAVLRGAAHLVDLSR